MAPGLRRRALRAVPRRESRSVRRGGTAGRQPGRRARRHRADAVDAGLLLERPGRQPVPRVVLLALPRSVAARRLDRVHRAGQRGRERSLRRDAQQGGRPHGLRRHLRGRRPAPRRRRQPGAGHRAPGRRLLHAAVRRARGRRRLRRLGAGDPCRDPSRPLPRHVPDDIVAAPSVPRTLTGKRVEVPLKRILRGNDAGDVLSVGSIGQPESLGWYAEFGRRRVLPLIAGAKA
jgi:hypothetical protein